MNSVAVFCGSSTGNNPEYLELARTLGHDIASRGLRLVFGGGHVGLMGAVANAALEAGGEVIGIIPQQLMNKEIGHKGITELRVTTSMHDRKATMEREADGFIALPGGFGTLDEFFEILTWGQLGIHRKPCGILDTETGFFRHLLAFADDAVEAGFVRTDHRDMLLVETQADVLLERMSTWKSTATPKWVEQTPNGVPIP